MEDSSLCVPPKPGSDSQFVCKDVMREVSAGQEEVIADCYCFIVRTQARTERVNRKAGRSGLRNQVKSRLTLGGKLLISSITTFRVGLTGEVDQDHKHVVDVGREGVRRDNRNNNNPLSYQFSWR